MFSYINVLHHQLMLLPVHLSEGHRLTVVATQEVDITLYSLTILLEIVIIRPAVLPQTVHQVATANLDVSGNGVTVLSVMVRVLLSETLMSLPMVCKTDRCIALNVVVAIILRLDIVM